MRNHRNVWKLVGGVSAVAVLAGTASGDIITITNAMAQPATLSDLYAWDEDGNQHVILQAGFGTEESADDIELGVGEGRVFSVNFTVEKLFVSHKIGNNSETEWELANTSIVGMSASMSNGSDDSWLHVSPLDEVGIGFVPPVGLVMAFEGGFSTMAPGWFVGTSVDLQSGVISDGFTGLATVALSGVRVEVTPAPASMALLALAGVVASRRRR